MAAKQWTPSSSGLQYQPLGIERWVKEEPDEGSSHCWGSQEAVQILDSGHRCLLQAPWADTNASFEGSLPPGLWVRRQQVTLQSSIVNGDGQPLLDPDINGLAHRACKTLDHRSGGEGKLVKEEILPEDTLERQRQHFREFRYQEAKGPAEAYRCLRQLCWQWLEPEKNTKEQILELLLLEQFLAILPMEIQNWVEKDSPETCAQAVALAEDFLLQQQEVKLHKEQVRKNC